MNTIAPSGAAAPAPDLHWSFNQNDAHQPEFGAELVAILRARRTGVAGGGSVTYRVLPNFWRGYRQGPAAVSLANGSIEVNAAPADPGDLVEYRVTSRNATSGDHATYSFRTHADPWRSMVGDWQIDVRNTAGDRYRRYRASGSVTELGAGSRAIVLSVGGAQVETGRWSGAVPLTTPWTLPETIPDLRARCEVALLEDLERLRVPAHLIPVGTWRWPPSHADLGTFTGWCVHAPGLLPTYYWVDDSGTVAVVSRLVSDLGARMSRRDSRPNVIFLHTDQQTWNAISAFGNPWLATPNMDRLQRNGVSFMRAYCTDPVCVPARTSWMTGRYSSETGSPFNGGLLHDDLPDLGQHLNRHGFPAYHSGKWHVSGREVTDSFRTLYYGETRIGAGGGEYYDGAITRSVVDFLTRHDGAEPFFLQIGLVNPHDVCEYGHNFEHKLIPDPVAQGILAEQELPPLPANFHYDEPETMTHRVVRRDDDALVHWPILRRTRLWSALQWRYLAWSLYRFVEKVDAEIGVILNAVQATGRADDTLILFTADHGEAAGQHQMFQKFTLYDESARVPFIAACLGDGMALAKGDFDYQHLISGVDVFPTVCDYAGVTPPPGLPGRSMRPLLEHNTGVAWRAHVLVESNYWARAVVTGRYKYVTEYRPRAVEDFLPPGPDDAELGIEQLFDLEGDPGETRNLAGDPGLAAVVADCRDRLAKTERTLRRRPLREGAPRRVVAEWGERLRQRWRQAS